MSRGGIIAVAAGAIVPAVIIYLATAFILMDLNPSAWPMSARATVVCIYVMAVWLVATLAAMMRDGF